jgi:hypothetical protein
VPARPQDSSSSGVQASAASLHVSKSEADRMRLRASEAGWVGAGNGAEEAPTNGHASMSSLESRQHLLLLQGGMPICSDRVKDELREQLSEIPRCSETSLITPV